VRRLTGVAAALGTTAALLAPAAVSAADDAGVPVSTTPAQSLNSPPLALLAAKPSAATTGAPVTLDGTASSDPDGSVARYEWDLDGDGSYETDGGATPLIVHTFAAAGAHEVGLRVTDDGGATSQGLLSLDVAAASKPDVTTPAQPGATLGAPQDPALAPPSAPRHSDPVVPSRSPASPTSSASPAPSVSPASSKPASSSPRESAPEKDPPVAKAAASTSVTISDFKFAPGTITVNVGDTVRWTNAGPTGHSATGSGFDTGILAKGSSGSATFSKAGTFSYTCTPHPFMKGTVVVKAAGTGGSGSSGSGSSSSAGSSGSGSGSSGSSGSTDPFGSTGSSSAAATDTGASLPTTGTNVVLVAAIGLGFLAAGLALRLAPRARRRDG
jgi:plastocyanin